MVKRGEVELELKISIIVPTVKGRESYLKLFLLSLARVNYPSKVDVELIVIYDGGNLNPSLVKNLQEHFNVRIIKNTIREGLAKARNVAAMASRGDILCFFDDDVIVDPEFMDSLLKDYERPVGGVVGKVWIAPSHLKNREFNELWNLAGKGALSNGGISGANMSFKKEVFQDIGGSDERLGVYSYSEDLDLFMRMKQARYKLIYDEKCAIIHFKAPKSGMEGEGLSPSTYLYYCIRNDTYVYLKNERLPLNVLKALRKSFKRFRYAIMSGRLTVLDLLSTVLHGMPKGFVHATTMYLAYKREAVKRKHAVTLFV